MKFNFLQTLTHVKKKKNSDIRQSNQEHVIGVGTSVLNDTGLQVIMKRLWCRTRYRV